MSRSVDPGYFFQTNDSIAERERKQKKSTNKRGKPFKLDSKLLAVLQAGPSSVFVARADGIVNCVNVAESKIEAAYTGATAPVTSLAIYGMQLFAGCWDKTIHSWDYISRRPARRFTGHSDFVKCITTSWIDGLPILISGSADSSIIVWSIPNGEKLHVIKGHTRAVLSLCVDPVSLLLSDHKDLVLVSSDSTKQIKQWRISKTSFKEESDPLTHHETSVNRIVFDAQNGEDDCEIGFWTASDDKTAQHVDRMRKYESDTKLEHPDFVRDIFVMPDYMYVVTACRDENIRVWSPHTAKLVATFDGHFEEVTGLTYIVLNDEIHLVSISIDGTIRHWSMNPMDIMTFRALADKRAKTGVDEEEENANKPKPLYTAEEEAELMAMME